MAHESGQPDEPARIRDEPRGLVVDAVQQAIATGETSLARLAQLAGYASAEGWPGRPELYERLAGRMLDVGQPLLAYDVSCSGLKHAPDSVRLKQLLALALARSGVPEAAGRVLWELYREQHRDGETLGILGRTYKDLWEQAAGADERRQYLEKSHEIYNEAYCSATAHNRPDDAIYTGINAATSAMLLGADRQAQEIARKVRELCLEKLQREDDYWAKATLGEAALIARQWKEAGQWYHRAAQQASGDHGKLSSTRRNARLLAEHICGDRHRFDHCFAIPKIIVFLSGWTDAPGRHRLPVHGGVRRLREALAAELSRYDDKVAYCGLTCESDLVFLEEMSKQNGQTTILLPSPLLRRGPAGGAPSLGRNWKTRLEGATRKGSRLIVAGHELFPLDLVAFKYIRLMQIGLARLQARMLDTDMVHLVLADSRTEQEGNPVPGSVKQWASVAAESKLLDLAVPSEKPLPAFRRRRSTKPVTQPLQSDAASQDGVQRKIAALLVADVRGYSQLTEDQIQNFAVHFLGMLAEAMRTLREPPVETNRWGDALFIAFRHVVHAGTFALDLRDRLLSIKWPEKGLPADLSLRIALHAGPVYCVMDAVTRLRSCIGYHATRAARIEPITPPNQIYASEAFAALAAAEGVESFACEYVGETPLAKGFGSFPTYHVRRTTLKVS